MAFQLESVVAIAVGIGLAAATGFRVFLPLLIASVAARWGGLPLAQGFQWLSSNGALLALGTASVVELVAYYIPLVDHVLDVIAGPAAVLAGVLASASAMVDIPPSSRPARPRGHRDRHRRHRRPAGLPDGACRAAVLDRQARTQHPE